MARIAAKDRVALADLYARHGRALLVYLRALTPDRGQAEELAQDTLLGVWHGAHTFQGRSSLRTWLLGVARRQAHNKLRRGGRVSPSVGEAALLPLADSDPLPEDVAIARATRDEIDAALALLSPIHREVLVLTFFHDLAHQEVAKVLDVPLGTVKSQLNHAKRALRDTLERGTSGRP